MNAFPTCPHFSLCSGCELSKNIFEPPVWKEALAFFARFGIEPQLHVDGFVQTRWKAKLAVRPGPEIGLFRKNSHEAISIPECLVHHTAINKGVSVIRQELIAHRLPPYRENPPSGLLRYIQLFVERSTAQIQLALIVNSDAISSQLERFCQELLKHDLWHSLWLNFHPSHTNRVLGDKWHLAHGKPFLAQTLHQTEIAFHPGAFAQAHLPLFEKMLQEIDAWVEPSSRIQELYAGVGAIGLSLRHKAKSLHLVENNPFAYLSFLETVKQLSSEERARIVYDCADAKTVSVDEADLLIVDPPRKGLEPGLLQKLCRLNRSRLIYVSCNFNSFQKDAEALVESGWNFKKATGYLFFPGTNSVETLALFEKDCLLKTRGVQPLDTCSK